MPQPHCCGAGVWFAAISALLPLMLGFDVARGSESAAGRLKRLEAFYAGRVPHDALDALSVAITSRKVNYILDADVRDFFGSVSRDWLVSASARHSYMLGCR